MHFVITDYFQKQLNSLKKRYPKIEIDFSEFKDSALQEGGIHMGGGIWKYRWRNSSIPTGKRGGLRIILWMNDTKVFPLALYPKTLKQNITSNEIEDALESVIFELEN